MTAPASWWLAGRVRCPYCHAVGALAYSDGARVVFCRDEQAVQTLVYTVEQAGGWVAVDQSLSELLGKAQPSPLLSVRWCAKPSEHRWLLHPWQTQQLASSRTRFNLNGHRASAPEWDS